MKISVTCIWLQNQGYLIIKRSSEYGPSLICLRDPPPENETWTNKVCRPGNSTYTISNANCYQGICQCNPGYFSSNSLDFCHHCPEPHIWNSVKEICESIKMRMNQMTSLRLIVYLSFSAVLTMNLRYLV